MRKINEKIYRDYTIAAHGWSYTVTKLADAIREFNELRMSATLYGNKYDGNRAILDTK